jgi:alpha-tubulin suppressor-like RCC1 family protein
MEDGQSNRQRERPTAAPSLDGARQIALGFVHGCALTKEGGVACWGVSTRGALGDGTLRDPSGGGGGGGRRFCTGEHERCVPTPIADLRDVAQVVAASSHSCARLTKGTVVCWGQNESGQLGDGTTTARPKPTAVSGLTDAVEVAVGGTHSCARRKDGSVSCWGSNGAGELGDGTGQDHAAPKPVTNMRDVVQIACGKTRSCARLADGTVSCWGGGVQKPAVVPNLSGVVDLVLGGRHACARTKDGAAMCWGDNENGQLGDGTTERRATPVRVNAITGATQLALGDAHTCAAVAKGGETRCWGRNGSHQLGDGTVVARHDPTQTEYR